VLTLGGNNIKMIKAYKTIRESFADVKLTFISKNEPPG